MFDVYISHHARLRPDAPAIVLPSGPISFARLDADVTRTAGFLQSLDGGPDRPVSVAIEDFYLNWVVMLALARLGFPSSPGVDRECPLRVSQRAEENPAVLVDQQQVAAMLSGPVPELTSRAIPPDELGRILLSSGTTGEEKRIALSWQMIEASIRNVPIAYGTPPGPWFMATGTHTILGFVLTLGCWAIGNAVMMVADPLHHADQVLAMKPGLIAMTPGQLGQFIEGLADDHPPQPLRAVTGGGPVPRKLLARTQAVLTHDFRSVYGASECGAVAIASPALIERSSAAAGYVLPGVTVQIVDEHGVPVASGELGHVRIRSDRVAKGYLRGKSEAFQDGWFISGDIGRLDPDGLLTLEGRADDLMNLRGQKVLPAWVEAAAERAPGVVEAAAFSVQDDDGWERCWIAVVAGGAFSEAAFTEAMKVPLLVAEKISWVLLDELPRNAMGKIDRNVLRERARSTELGRD
jgi:O-succinylbenzoic acid--CoA ligase